MRLNHRTHAARVTAPEDRLACIDVLNRIYTEEKGWIDRADTTFPEGDLGDGNVTWLLARRDGEPAGVLRILYDPPLHLYKEYAFQSMDPNLDIDAFIRGHRIAEVGRLAILPQYRRKIGVVLELMRAAAEETLRRGFTHYITDVFEGEVNSPYLFHVRVIGFRPVATHETGEMNCPRRRITLILNLREALIRLRKANNRFFRAIGMGLDERLIGGAGV